MAQKLVLSDSNIYPDAELSQVSQMLVQIWELRLMAEKKLNQLQMI